MQIIGRTLAEIESLATVWNGLAKGVPFRSWEWSTSWWRHYAADGELYTLLVYDSSRALVAIAPWHRVRSHAQGRVLRFLGSGEVCSDYLSVLCRPGCEDPVADSLAAWLTDQAARGKHDDRWDLLELAGVDAEDTMIPRLANRLQGRGCVVHQTPGPNCWRLELPVTWTEYEAQLSKSHRKQVRRFVDRTLATGRAVLHTVQTPQELAYGWQVLLDLHQRRRQSLGEPGSFASPRFAAFHAELAARMLASGRLRLHWLDLDGSPIAAEYHLASENVVYGYQAGVDPPRMHEEPGRLAAIATLQLAQADGYRVFDFLRGDEPYKAHWRATPRASLKLRIVPDRSSARWRHHVWLAGQRVKETIAAATNPGACPMPDAKPQATVDAVAGFNS